MLKTIILLILLTLAPFLELRASIPFGILSDINPVLVVVVAVITNILLAPLVWLFVNTIMHIFLRIELISRLYHKTIERVQKKAHSLIKKYGIFGLALFVGIPLPGSGVYSGVLASYLLGMDFKKTMIGCALGVILAATAVTLIVLFGNGVFSWAVKNI